MKQKQPLIIYAMAGAVTAFFTQIIYYPLQTIKIRAMASWKHQNILIASKHISLYKGFILTLNIIPSTSAFFATYQYMKRTISIYNKQLNHFISASIGQLIGGIIRNPFDLVRKQLVVGRSGRLIDCVKNIYMREGIGGFYVGYIPSLIRDIPFAGIQLMCYQYFKRMLKKNNKDQIFYFSIVGSLASIISAFLTTPLDVLQTKIMTKILHHETNIIRDFIHQREFFKGVKYRCSILGFTGIFWWLFYEKALLVIKKYNIYQLY